MIDEGIGRIFLSILDLENKQPALIALIETIAERRALTLPAFLEPVTLARLERLATFSRQGIRRRREQLRNRLVQFAQRRIATDRRIDIACRVLAIERCCFSFLPKQKTRGNQGNR